MKLGGMQRYTFMYTTFQINMFKLPMVITTQITKFSATSFKWGTVTTEIKDVCQSSHCFKGHYPDMFTALQSVLNFSFVVEINPPQNILGSIK